MLQPAVSKRTRDEVAVVKSPVVPHIARKNILQVGGIRAMNGPSIPEVEMLLRSTWSNWGAKWWNTLPKGKRKRFYVQVEFIIDKDGVPVNFQSRSMGPT